MKNAITIACRDCAGAFRNGRTLTILGLVVLLWQFFFFNIIGRFQYIVSRAAGMALSIEIRVPTFTSFVIEPYGQLVVASFALIIPLFAMNLFPAERSNGVIELLFTSPVRRHELVLGRWLGLLFIVGFLTLVAILIPTLVLLYANDDLGGVIGLSIGIALAAITLCSGGLVVACGSQSALQCAVYGVALGAFLLLLHTPAAIAPGSVRLPFELASLFVQTENLLKGFFPLSTAIYFVCVNLALVWGAITLIEQQRASSRSDAERDLIARMIGPVLLLVAILAVLFFPESNPVFVQVNVIFGLACILIFNARALLFWGIREWRTILRVAAGVMIFVWSFRAGPYLDLTPGGAHSLAPATLARLTQLSHDVTMTYILQGDRDQDDEALRLLRRMKAHALGAIELQVVDPTLSPRFGIEQMAQFGDRLFVENPLDNRRIRLSDITEASVVGALCQLLASSPQRVYFLGEAGAAQARDTGITGVSTLVQFLGDEGIEGVDISVRDVESLENAVVAWIGPRQEAAIDDLNVVVNFLHRGGKVFIAGDPLRSASFEPLLHELSIDMGGGVVLDGAQLAFNRGSVGLQPLVRRFGEHPVVNFLGSARAVLMNIASPLRSSPHADERIEVQELFWASEGSTIEEEPLGLLSGSRSFAPSLVKGTHEPIALGAAVQISSQPMAIVFGDSDWLLNSAIELYSNRDLASNAMHWLLGNSWALRIEAREAVPVAPAINAREIGSVFLFVAGLLELLLVGGAVSLWRRRARSIER